jgi:hypothetical protein
MTIRCKDVHLVFCLLLLICSGCNKHDAFTTNQRLYNRVVDRVQSGEIKADTKERGVTSHPGSTYLAQSVILPPDLKSASVNGEIYIFRTSPSQLFIIFSTWRGKGFNMEGFLYAAAPLTPPDIGKNSYGRKVVFLGPMELSLDQRLNANWYRVSYNLD